MNYFEVSAETTDSTLSTNNSDVLVSITKIGIFSNTILKKIFFFLIFLGDETR